MVLAKLKKGENAQIVKINSTTVLYNRLVSMGIVEGSHISMISGGTSGPFLFESEGRSFALGREMAEQIEIIKK